MQKKAGTGGGHQAQNFAQGPKIFGTGRLMNRIPNLMDQQVALQNQQKIGQDQQQQQNQQMNPHHGQQQQQQQHPHPMHPMGGPPPQPQQQQGGGGNNGPEDMFAFQNFLAQISKSGGPQQQQPGPLGHPGMGGPLPPGAGKPMPGGGGGNNSGRMWGPEEANMLANNQAGTPPIIKMIMHQQQQQQQQQAQFIQENLKRQQQAMTVEALVQAAQVQAGLRLSPNGEWGEGDGDGGRFFVGEYLVFVLICGIKKSK